MIVVLDIDGTLANNDHRAHHVDRVEGDPRPKDWESFLAPHLVAKDTVVEGAERGMKHFIALGYRLVFLTGRRDALRLTTLLWLKEKFDLDVQDDALIMRPPGNMLSPRVFKRERVLALKHENPKQDFLFIDDDKYTWEMYAEFGVVLRAPTCWDSIFPHNTEVEPVDIWRK